MWLINTTTLQLEEFVGENVPEYAILSHRWRDGEVLFHEIDTPTAHAKKGYAKIIATCQRAKNDGIGYAWIDTCCIDKKSSAELSEAINSMYQWYANSKVCYAYLDDVRSINEMEESEWFTRGWTLQELIAPKAVVFFAGSWKVLGTKKSLENLDRWSGVNKAVLLTTKAPQACSIAIRMSWASKRKTSRLEDQAYSLMGLFDVNMPLLYGEGQKAFVRLQEEIIKRSHDESILAWPDRDKTPGISNLLARSPVDFSYCGQTRTASMSLEHTAPSPWTMTNLGLSIRLPLRSCEESGMADVYVALLRCTHHNLKGPSGYGHIYLTPVSLPCQLVFARLLLGEKDDLCKRKHGQLRSQDRFYDLLIQEQPLATKFWIAPDLQLFTVDIVNDPDSEVLRNWTRSSHRTHPEVIDRHTPDQSEGDFWEVEYPSTLSGELFDFRGCINVLPYNTWILKIGLDTGFRPVIAFHHALTRYSKTKGIAEILPDCYEGTAMTTSGYSGKDRYAIHAPGVWYVGLTRDSDPLSQHRAIRCFLHALDCTVTLTRQMIGSHKNWHLRLNMGRPRRLDYPCIIKCDDGDHIWSYLGGNGFIACTHEDADVSSVEKCEHGNTSPHKHVNYHDSDSEFHKEYIRDLFQGK
jgi:hypothetical protein